MTLAKRMIDEALVGLASGAAFSQSGECALRLCFASRLDKLEKAMVRLARVLG